MSRRRPPPTIDLQAIEITSPGEPHAAPKAAAAAERPADPPMAERPAAEPPVGAEAPVGAPPEGPPPRAREAVARSGDSPWLAMAAGIAGAASTLLILAGLWLVGAIPRPDAGLNQLASRITALEGQLREVAGRPAPVLDTKPVDELSRRLAGAEQEMRRLAGLEARLGKLETAAAAPRPPAPAPSAPVADPALANRLAAAEATLKSLGETAADLRRRAEAAEAAAKTPAPRPEAPAPVVDTAQLDALAGRLAALERDLKAISDRVAKVAAPAPAADRPVRLALAASALRAAVERGDPFAVELAAVRPLADAAALAPLEPFAAKGVPSERALARDLSALAPAMLSAAGPPAQEGGGGGGAGLIDRLAQSAERLVRIRPTTETAGSDPGSLIARAETKAARGDIAGAAADLARLPPTVRAPAAGWIETAGKRSAAVEAARRLAASAFDALGNPS